MSCNEGEKRQIIYTYVYKTLVINVKIYSNCY